VTKASRQPIQAGSRIRVQRPPPCRLRSSRLVFRDLTIEHGQRIRYTCPLKWNNPERKIRLYSIVRKSVIETRGTGIRHIFRSLYLHSTDSNNCVRPESGECDSLLDDKFKYDGLLRMAPTSLPSTGPKTLISQAQRPESDMSKMRKTITRRNVLQCMPSVTALLIPTASWTLQSKRVMPNLAHDDLDLPVLAQPDLVFALVGDSETVHQGLWRSGSTWTGTNRAAGVKVDFAAAAQQAVVSITSPTVSVQRIQLRWKKRLAEDVLALGDAWERSYGDLEWRPLQAERALPWYALLHSQGRTTGMGIKTGAASFAFWQADPSGISLWLDVRNGGNGVSLGSRTLEAATIVQCKGASEESAFAVTQRLCRAMAEGTQVPTKRGGLQTDAIIGSNDWYYAYGQNTHDGILRDADLVASLAPAGGIKPFTVIDDGYQDPSRFPSLPRLASAIRDRDVIPGLWIRPLRAAQGTPANLLLPDSRWSGPRNEQGPVAYDPTIPEALNAVASVAAKACDWGFELIKHDFTTWELFGLWGSQMGASPTRGNWHFNDLTVTNAEIVTALYRQLRATCGQDRLILGCNTVGHLSVGLFDASRTGDDVSGKEWERTRRTGVNTLAFRAPHHRTFYSVDADCVAITSDVPWSMGRQWLQAVANSGTVLLISSDPRATGNEQKQSLREAFERSLAKPASEPLDWMKSRTPASWRSAEGAQNYVWIQEEGESPFPIGIQRGPD
jgi:alpha-galactosidase